MTELVLTIFIYMSAWFLVATARKNNGLADVAWGIGFVLVSWIQFTGAQHSLLISILISLWGLRLFSHIAKRNIGKPEDFRYANWRKEWGKWVITRSFFQVFMLQGFLMGLMLWPTLAAHQVDQSLSLWAYLGFTVWVFGFLFEAIGDFQLKQFIKVKKPGQIMQTGLWKYTRHPNYFGEATLWWGISLIAFDATGSWLSFITAITITILVRFVSGVPMLEKKYEGRKEWEAYKKKTSAFIPWFTRKS